MNIQALMGQFGGQIRSDTTATGKFMGAQAIGDVTITAIVQPDFSPNNGRDGDAVPDQGVIYGDITSITFVGKLVLFNSGR